MSESALTSRGNRDAIRNQMRRLRREIGTLDRLAAEREVAGRVSKLAAVWRARHVAAYLAFDGELSLGTFMSRAARRGQRVYLPVIGSGEMQFRLLTATTTLIRNRYGIPEPSDGPYIDVRSLDVVLAPLVAFDENGVRLGMGGGYYDRCFRFLRTRSEWRKPKLIGVAFEFQCVEKLDEHTWDVGLDGIVTEKRSRRF
ncbi:MAG TPA: 5-formyltetrahydrofolate cyclo-ligase [Gammaproteobacteria bacterium]